jgi:hypothetical protein
LERELIALVRGTALSYSDFIAELGNPAPAS